MPGELWHRDRRRRSGGYFTIRFWGWFWGILIFLAVVGWTHGLALWLLLLLPARWYSRWRQLPTRRVVSSSVPLVQHQTAIMFENDVYLMHSPAQGAYKIGYSGNVGARYNALRTGCHDLQLVRTFRGGRQLEQELHRKFAYRRVAGEWFKLSEQEVAYLLNLP